MLWLGLFAVLFSALSAMGSIVHRMAPESRWPPTRWPRLEKLLVSIILAAAIVSGVILVVQDRGRAESDARLDGMRSTQDRVYKILLAQEVLQSIQFTISPIACATPREITMGQSLSPDLHSLKLILAAIEPGRRISDDEVVEMQVWFQYGPIWVQLVGVGNDKKDTWFYALGEAPAPMDGLSAIKYKPVSPPTRWSLDLVSLTLGERALAEWLARPPQVLRFVSTFRTDTFDPRTELGFVLVPVMGTFKRSELGDAANLQTPFAHFASWRSVPFPSDWLGCWEINADVNNRRLASFVRPKAVANLLSDLERRWRSWPKAGFKVDDPGFVWLAPFPDVWDEYRPYMNQNLRYLLYGESTPHSTTRLPTRDPEK
jgi:hypothetical protein